MCCHEKMQKNALSHQTMSSHAVSKRNTSTLYRNLRFTRLSCTESDHQGNTTATQEEEISLKILLQHHQQKELNTLSSALLDYHIWCKKPLSSDHDRPFSILFFRTEHRQRIIFCLASSASTKTIKYPSQGNHRIPVMPWIVGKTAW